ncbi:MAG TPA: Hsp20/alpha crystallin family protein [Thermomicrobiales bacterium]
MSEKTPVPAKSGEVRARRWDPLGLLAEMEAEMERLWNERWPMGSLFGGRLGRGLSQNGFVWAPRADVFAKNGDLVVKVELPGVKKDEVDVSIEGGDLVIRGERKAEEKVEEKDYYRMERSYGAFYRRWPLPEGVDPDKVEASFEDGVLTVRVPKGAVQEPEAKKIPIR